MVHGDCIDAFIVPLKSQLGSARPRSEGALRLRPRRGRHRRPGDLGRRGAPAEPFLQHTTDTSVHPGSGPAAACTRPRTWLAADFPFGYAAFGDYPLSKPA